MDSKQAVAIGIALQAQVLRICPLHQQIYLDDDADPAGAFALALELVHQREAFVREFDDQHELTDLLSETLGLSPVCCLQCRTNAPRMGFQRAAMAAA